MMPIIFISLGLIMSFTSAIKLLEFSSELAEGISELDEIFSSKDFLMYKNLKTEVDELNYSYYEILERQDKRISMLEREISSKFSTLSSLPSFASTDSVGKNGANDLSSSDSSVVSSDHSTVISSDHPPVIPSEVERSPNPISSSEEVEETLNSRVLKMNHYGISKEKIASELDIGIGRVEVICSVYGS